MRRITVGLLVGLCLFLTVPAFAQEGFTGPGPQQGGFNGPSAQSAITRVVDIQNLWDDTWVVLQGNIVRALGKEKYLFRDSTGEVTVEIDKEVWRGVSIGVSDMVEIRGELDKGWKGTEIEVKVIAKL